MTLFSVDLLVVLAYWLLVLAVNISVPELEIDVSGTMFAEIVANAVADEVIFMCVINRKAIAKKIIFLNVLDVIITFLYSVISDVL